MAARARCSLRGAPSWTHSQARTLLRTDAVWAVAGHYALTDAGWLSPAHGDRPRQRHAAAAAVAEPDRKHRPSGRSAERQADRGRLRRPPPTKAAGTQVTDALAAQPGNGTGYSTCRTCPPPSRSSSRACPGQPTAGWYGSPRAEGHNVVAVWRPGQKQIAVRRVRLPVRDSGSDTFVVWTGAPTR